MSERQGGDKNPSGARMKHAATQFLFAYWNRIRGDRLAPERREVEPAEIGRILSDTFILEAAPRGSYPYRLAGTHVCSLFGRELKGADWMSLWPEGDRADLHTVMRGVAREGAGAFLVSRARNARGQSVPLETVILPLIHRGGLFDRMLGATGPLDEPYWLGASPIVELSIIDFESIPPACGPRMAHSAPMVPPLQAPLPRRRLGHLALYDGGRPD